MAERKNKAKYIEITCPCGNVRLVPLWRKQVYCSNLCAVRLVDHRKKATLATRFWAGVKRTETCWLWAKSRMTDGYGLIGVTRNGTTANVGTHRVSWEIHNGPIPAGLQVLHRCDNPPCVRPDHLFLGTHKDNMQDAANKGRMRNGLGGNCILTPVQVRSIRAQYAEGGTSYRQLAREFDVSSSTINHIIKRRNWVDL